MRNDLIPGQVSHEEAGKHFGEIDEEGSVQCAANNMSSLQEIASTTASVKGNNQVR